MIAIVGLGNVGKEYENTHHNVGFMAVDYFAKNENMVFNKNKYEGSIAQGVVEGKTVLLLKPSTFMNLSGNSVLKMLKMTGTPISQLIVVYDDVDLPLGKIRVREKGSAGTHNGMRNIINCIGSENFVRIRIGIGKPENMDLADYVLSKLSITEKAEIEKSNQEVSNILRKLIANNCNTNGLQL